MCYFVVIIIQHICISKYHTGYSECVQSLSTEYLQIFKKQKKFSGKFQFTLQFKQNKESLREDPTWQDSLHDQLPTTSYFHEQSLPYQPVKFYFQRETVYSKMKTDGQPKTKKYKRRTQLQVAHLYILWDKYFKIISF